MWGLALTVLYLGPNVGATADCEAKLAKAYEDWASTRREAPITSESMGELEELYRGVVKDCPDFVGAQKHLSATLLSQQKYSEVILILRPIVNADRSDECAVRFLAVAEYSTGDWKEAAAHLEDLFAHDHDNEADRRMYLEALLRLGHPVPDKVTSRVQEDEEEAKFRHDFAQKYKGYCDRLGGYIDRAFRKLNQGQMDEALMLMGEADKLPLPLGMSERERAYLEERSSWRGRLIEAIRNKKPR